MANPEADPLFQGVSASGRSQLRSLQGVVDELSINLKAMPSADALGASGHYRALLRDIDQLVVEAAGDGEGPAVSKEDAQRTGQLLHADIDGRFLPIGMADAAGLLSKGLPMLVAGAGSSMSALLSEAEGLRGTVGGAGLVVQFVGIDRQHWSTDKAISRLEANIVRTAAFMVLNSALNRAGIGSVAIAHGFACWVVNRALQALPESAVTYARCLQLDAMGGADVLQDLVRAKQGGLGAICHLQSASARQALASEFGVSPAVLAALPVDLAPVPPAAQAPPA